MKRLSALLYTLRSHSPKRIHWNEIHVFVCACLLGARDRSAAGNLTIWCDRHERRERNERRKIADSHNAMESPVFLCDNSEEKEQKQQRIISALMLLNALCCAPLITWRDSEIYDFVHRKVHIYFIFLVSAVTLFHFLVERRRDTSIVFE